MPLTFADSSEFQLTLPDPAFSIGFSIREFVSKRLEKPDSFQDIFRVKGGVAFKSVALGRTILEENLYDTQIVTLPKRANVQLNEWDQYFKTLQSLVFTLGKQLAKVDDAWLAEHASRAMEAKAGFLAANQKMQELK